jgi:hypothetical protein
MRQLSDSIFSDSIAGTIALPHLGGSSRIIIASDYSGTRQDSHQVYSFLVTGAELMGDWIREVSMIRQSYFFDRRRMCFKRLNDKIRLRALAPYLQVADQLPGVLYQFAVSNDLGSVFEPPKVLPEEAGLRQIYASRWKPAVFERLMRIVHFGAFLLAGLSRPGQDVLWISDEDAIMPNRQRMYDIAPIIANVTSSYLDHNMGNFRWTTTEFASQKNMHTEDLAALPDLSGGAILHYLNNHLHSLEDGQEVQLDERSNTILSWLIVKNSQLEKRTTRFFLNSLGHMQTQTLHLTARSVRP